MKRALLTIGGIITATALWAALLFWLAIRGGSEDPMTTSADPQDFAAAAIALIEEANVGNTAFALLRKGEIAAQHYASIGTPVDGDTLFQMASVSKWVTSVGIMKLVEAQRLELDRPVNAYLNRWQVPASEHDTNQVTVRRLLSHSAGLTDGLGYAGHATASEVQTLEASLTQAADAWSPFGGATVMGAPADGTWRYSGGGYTILQLLIEEVSGQDFNEFMRAEVLLPLGMARSSFVVDRKTVANLADSYDSDGSIAPHYYYTALAAASLYSSTNDLARFAQSWCASPSPASPSLLSDATRQSVRKPHATYYNMNLWGLGAALFARNDADRYVIGHDGGNRPAINTTVRVDPDSCDGIIVLTSGSGGLASHLGLEWIRWRFGDTGAFGVLSRVNGQVPLFLIGFVVILIGGLLLAWRLGRTKSRST